MAKVKGLFKRGNIWWLRYAGLNGQMIQESSGTASYKDAYDRLISKRKLITEGKNPANENKRMKRFHFTELADIYDTWCKDRQKGYEHFKKSQIRLLKKEFACLPLVSFSTVLIDRYQTKLIGEQKKNATVNRLVGTLKAMFSKAVEWEMVDEDILKKIRKVKQLPENNKRLRFLSQEEIGALLDACKAYPSYSRAHLRPIVTVVLNSGMRKEEVLSLEWDKHIDLKHGFILLDKTKNGERRELPINQPIREALAGLVRRLDSPYVFVDKDGKRYRGVVKAFKSACKKAGIKDWETFRFHDLRHTFASHLVMRGVDLTTVMKLLGHADIKMTLRYAHLAPGHTAKAVQVLDDMFKVKGGLKVG